MQIDGTSGDTVSTDLTRAVLNEFLNDALQESYEIQIEKWADYYTKLGAETAFIIGQDYYALPSDFYKLRKVEYSTGPDRWIRLFPHDLEAAHLYPVSGSRPARYRIQGRSLVFVPTPGAAGTFRTYYIPIRTTLTDDPDVVTFDVPNEQKLVLAIAWRDCLDRQELDPTPALTKIETLTKWVRTAADNRDAAEPFYLSATGPPLSSSDDSSDDGWF
jgi:hypothetical protein